MDLMMVLQIAAGSGTGTAIALVILYFYIQRNQDKIKTVCKAQKEHEQQCDERITKAEDCFEEELKEVKAKVDIVQSNTTALVQHLVATTDREQHPHAVQALETVLRKNGGRET